MEYNKILSARIRRRNKQGFKGIGNHCYSPTITATYEKEKTISPNQHIANQAYAIGLIGKHKGSKPTRRLKNAISQFDSKHYWEKKAEKAREK